jgi:hemoglobin-like flavoprotein
MQDAIKRLNSLEMRDFGTQLEIGIGINYGKAFVGHLGHPRHRQFAVVGDPVNVASRIQGMTKDSECPILISESTLKGIPKETLKLGRSFVKKIKGIETAVKLHELHGFTEVDINLELQSSLDFIMSDTDTFASRFYARVFEAAPEVRALFKHDMAMQGRMLTHMLIGIVYSLSRPQHLVLGLKTLGKSHSRYGVRPEHYPIVKKALLETIEEQLAEHCSSSICNAWSQALDLVTDAMRNWEAA